MGSKKGEVQFVFEQLRLLCVGLAPRRSLVILVSGERAKRLYSLSGVIFGSLNKKPQSRCKASVTAAKISM